jgi:maleylacetoacetate isomerase
MKLYQGRRSSASWRVRWALALKALNYETVWIDIAAGEHRKLLPPINPLCTVPTLVLADGRSLSESTAIIEYLDELHPSPALLPSDPWQRARARQLAQIVNSEIQPLQNSGVRQAISHDADGQAAWARRWIERGLAAYETLLKQSAGRFSVGDTLSVADLFLLPQVENGHRFGADLTPFKRIDAVCKACLDTPQARATHPRLMMDGHS